MKRKLRQLLVLTLLISGVILQSTGIAEEGLPGVESVGDLDRLADLHFAIMSDNKGDSPLSSVEFARMTAWIKEGHPAFYDRLGRPRQISVGKHLYPLAPIRTVVA